MPKARPKFVCSLCSDCKATLPAFLNHLVKHEGKEAEEGTALAARRAYDRAANSSEGVHGAAGECRLCAEDEANGSSPAAALPRLSTLSAAAIASTRGGLASFDLDLLSPSKLDDVARAVHGGPSDFGKLGGSPPPSLYLPCTFPVPYLYLPCTLGSSAALAQDGGHSSQVYPRALPHERARALTTAAACRAAVTELSQADRRVSDAEAELRQADAAMGSAPTGDGAVCDHAGQSRAHLIN
jgi:hypothetical protein